MKKNKIVFLLLVALLILGTASFADGQDKYTLMIYLNGSDLESTYDAETNSFIGSATEDLNEMIAGYKPGTGVNVLVQTGGTANWNNDYVNPELTQRFELTASGFVEMETYRLKTLATKKRFQIL